MSEDVARAVGARETMTVSIAGKECQVRPLVIRELAEVQRECLKMYKRQWLETYRDNQDLLDDDERAGLMSRKIDEASQWDIGDLPSKTAFDSTSLKLTKRVKQWIDANVEGFKDPKEKAESNGKTDQRYRNAVVTMLDSGELEESEYKKMSGRAARKGEVGYVNWWITGDFDGMITMIWVVFKSYDVTKEQVAKELSFAKLAEVSRAIENLTVPAVGNGI